MKIVKQLKANELLELISKQWATTKDIQLLGCIGADKARCIKKDIQEKLKSQKYMLPNNYVVPMKELISYLKIDISYLRKVERRMKYEEN